MTPRGATALVPPAVDTLPINFAILDDDGTIVFTNRAWREFAEANDLELRPDTIGVNYVDVAAKAQEDDAQVVAEGLSEILAGDRETLEYEYPCHSPNEERWFLMRAAAFTHDGSRYVAIAHSDVTERLTYRHRLEESNERLEQFAYAASHDLQEPLRMITNYLRLLERRFDDDLDEDAAEFVAFAVDGAERMKAMIDGLLEYSRVETRGEPFDPVDLDAVVAGVLDDLQFRIEETGAEIAVEPLPTVTGDERQLRRVIQNLLTNALEYSGDAGPQVTIDAERVDAEWIISVRDEGIGIDPSATERIFGVFQRLHTFDEHPGTGIGLALCERIVERHGGEIWVESEPGEGSTFSFTLPAVDDREE